MFYRRPIRHTEVAYEDDYPMAYEPSSSGIASIFMIILLIIAFGWIISNSERGTSGPSAIIEPATVAPVYTPPAPVVVNPIVTPVVAYETAPVSTIIARGKITAHEVNLRTGPGLEYDASYLLARDVTVAILNQSHTSANGEPWVKVGIETPQGPVTGWVNRRYIAY